MSELPEVCFIEDVARALRASVRTIRKMRSHGVFPIAELDRIDRRPRWSGKRVREFIDGGQSLRAIRRSA